MNRCIDFSYRLILINTAVLLLVINTSQAINRSPENYSVIEKNNLKGLINSKGKVLIPPEYDDMGWSSGVHLVINDIIGYKINSKWGLISIENSRITKPEYKTLQSFNKDLIIASKSGLTGLTYYYGIINNKGKGIIPFKYISLEKAGELLIAVSKNNSALIYGLIDTKDRPIIPFEYTKIEMINSELFSLKDSDDQFRLYNITDNLLSKECFDELAIMDNQFILAHKNGKVGLLNKDGRLVLDPIYKKIVLNDNTSLNVLPFTKWEALNLDNNIRAEFQYDKVVPVNKSIYKVSTNGTDHFINQNGSFISIPGEINIDRFLSTSAIFRENGKFGLISLNGAVLIEPDFDQIDLQNPYLICRKNGYYQVFNLTNNILSDENYAHLSLLHSNLLGFKKGDFWGVLDYTGGILIEAKYDSLLESTHDLLKVLFYGETGIIDLTDQWMVLPRKSTIDVFSENMYMIRDVFGSSIRDFSGNVHYQTDNRLRRHDKIFIEDDWNDFYGLVNGQYKKILPVNNDTIRELIPDSVFLFHNHKGWGTVIKNGQILFEEDNRFQEIQGESEGYIGIKIDGKYGFIDTKGRIRISNQYEEIGVFQDGAAPVRILNKWGFVDKLERITVQPHYDAVSSFINGLSIVFKNNKYGLIDKTGKRMLETEYDSLYRTSHDSYIFKYNNKFGLADKSGRITLFPKFEELTDLGNGFIIAQRKDKKGLISTDGVAVIPQIYDEIVFDQYSDVYLCGKKSKWNSFLIHDLLSGI